MDIQNSVALVTGSASGMGMATAILLHQLGARVALLDINKNKVESIAKGIDAIAIECDVTQHDSVERALLQVNKELGDIRICVNCAGIIHSRRMVNQQGPMPLEEFNHIITVNLIGTYNVMRLVAAAMIPLAPVGASHERGVIINTASIAAFEGQIGQTAYSASKAAIIGLILPAARELASFGIRVMGIAPGLVDTPMFEQLPDEAKKNLTDTIPFPKRLAHPEEFASLVEQIIINPMLNGTVIRLDGALRMHAK